MILVKIGVKFELKFICIQMKLRHVIVFEIVVGGFYCRIVDLDV